jgi:hypothetical protein
VWPSRGLAMLGAIKLLGDQLAMPSQDRIRLRLVTSSSACLLSFLPISAKVRRSVSQSCTRPLIWSRKMRFSATRYSIRRRSSSSTDPVM